MTREEFLRKNHRHITNIKRIISNDRLVQNRINMLRALGYIVEWRCMGVGGVGQLKLTRKEARVQISAGWGRFNYAFAVIFNLES
jgi:hypothetical protein